MHATTTTTNAAATAVMECYSITTNMIQVLLRLGV